MPTQYGLIVVEHRDRLARFGSEYIEAALAALGRKVVVVDADEVRDDLAQDMIELLASLWACLYGRRSARHRAEKALTAVSLGGRHPGGAVLAQAVWLFHSPGPGA